MTILVYRDGILASDSQLINRHWAIIGTATKITRVEVDDPVTGGVYLCGATGDFAYCAKFLKWCGSKDFLQFLKDADYASPAINPTGKDQVCTGFIVKPDGACVRFEADDPPYECRADWYAFGSGDLVAIGALAAGASARQAVEIAIEFDPPSKGPIQELARVA